MGLLTSRKDSPYSIWTSWGGDNENMSWQRESRWGREAGGKQEKGQCEYVISMGKMAAKRGRGISREIVVDSLDSWRLGSSASEIIGTTRSRRRGSQRHVTWTKEKTYNKHMTLDKEKDKIANTWLGLQKKKQITNTWLWLKKKTKYQTHDYFD